MGIPGTLLRAFGHVILAAGVVMMLPALWYDSTQTASIIPSLPWLSPTLIASFVFMVGALGVIIQQDLAIKQLRENRPAVRLADIITNGIDVFQKQIGGTIEGYFVNDPPFDTHVTNLIAELVCRTWFKRERVIKQFSPDELTVSIVRSRDINQQPNDWAKQDLPLHIYVGGTNRSDQVRVSIDSDLTFIELVDAAKHKAELKISCLGQRQEAQITRIPIDWGGVNVG